MPADISKPQSSGHLTTDARPKNELLTTKAIVEYALSNFQSGQRDNAFHSLIEAGPNIIPELINLYEKTTDIDIQVLTIEVTSEFRLSTSLNFLKHALRQENPKIWKRALNGLAMVGSIQVIEALDHVLASDCDAEKRAWIEEVMSDISARLKAEVG
ncbi:MAG: HEAT repeat domain-containing protein [Verrucomicrobiota bacterium]